MEFTFKVQKTVKIAFVQASAGVRYWEDATVNGEEDTDGLLIPCRIKDRWEPRIDVSNGQITNWTKGVTASIHYNVCDDGTYSLIDENGEVVKIKDGYVPDIMCPNENGFGDYIIMDIDENGFIADFKKTLSGFSEEDED